MRMHTQGLSTRSSARVRVVCLLLGSVLLPALTGCSSDKGPTASFNVVCEENGLCECTDNSQCAETEVCFNGWCQRTEPVPADVTEDVVGRFDVHFDTAIPPGAFKSPCETDDDCNSKICLETTNGVSVCSQECVDDCPEDWECRGVSLAGGMLTFLCFPPLDRLCQPCQTDISCTGTKNLCLDIGGVLSCGRDCSDVGCPSGYLCQEMTSVGDVTGMQCVPENGTCQCTPETVGNLFECSIDNEFGTCWGQRMCQEDGSLTECDAAVPEAEACDGKDNDCDGFIDEESDLGTCTVENEFGVCSGARVCIPGVGEVCKAATPAAEVCDTLDNDCDGTVDEDFTDEDGAYTLLDHCGQCNNACAGKFAHADEVACDATGEAPTCILVSCEPGFALAQGNLCLPPIHHLCEPCTDDSACVGLHDRCLLMSPTDTQTFCARDCSPDNEYAEECPSGYVCETLDLDGETVQQCVPENGTCDCNELSDGQVKPCQNQNEHGLCFGVATCDPEEGWQGCTAGTPEEEVCDGFDNDCDGIIDETSGTCEVSNPFGTCTGIEICLGEEGAICSAQTPSAEVCDGKDNDCNGTVDDDFATSIYDDDGSLLLLLYNKDEANCGGCGVPCTASAPAAEVSCVTNDGIVQCQVDSCLPGYYVYQDAACLPIPTANLCLPCAADGDCFGPDDLCLDFPNGKYCGRDCAEGSVYSVGNPGDPGYCSGVDGEQGCCPVGFLCMAGQCHPQSGDCECSQDGKLRPCTVTNEFGTCAGVSACLTTGPDAGWQPCQAPTPAPEVCDGLDNDCDGLLDAADDSVDTTGVEGYPDCYNVSDACSGNYTCQKVNGLFQWVCSAAQPTDELCNGQDDDCDGEVDEDFTDNAGLFTLLEHCGHCGLDCRLALGHLATDEQGTPLADAASCVLVDGEPTCLPGACEPGFYLFPTADEPTVCLPLQGANCQPCATASDCPGIGHGCVPVGEDSGLSCATRCDADSPFPGCTGIEGDQGCCPDGFACQHAPGLPQDEMHCLPVTDTCQCQEGNVGLERPCTVAGDPGKTCFGTSACSDLGNGLFGWSPCDTSINVEVCDGQDNNCNGIIDDGFLVDGVYVSDAHCGACGKNCAVKWSASQQHALGVCDDSLPGGPDCVIGECVANSIGGGTPCHADSDCAGDPAGPTCLPELLQCGQWCTVDGDCNGGICRDGTCHPACAGDGECVAAFGPWSQCTDGGCGTLYQYVDLDGWTGNGCECPATDGLVLDEPDLFASLPLPGQPVADRDCDGIDGDLETALFVVAGSANGDGSYGSPFGTIGEALQAFDPALHAHVLVSTGSYAERLVLTDGVRLYGGYSPDFLVRDIALYPSVIDGPAPPFDEPGTLPGTVYASGIATDTVMAGFTIIGYDVPPTAAAAGQPSYAVYLANSSGALTLTNNRIIGGTGGAGTDGANGNAGSDGGNGGNGLHSTECVNGDTCIGNTCNQKNCSGHQQPGGAGGANGQCGSTTGCPGMEAEGAESPQQADNPPAGCSYANGGSSGTYQNGPWNHCKYDCTVSANMVGADGINGSDGGPGSGGTGCASAFGAFPAGTWQGPSAATGSSGSPGSGGQGGGAGAYINNLKSNNCTIGEPLGDLGGSGGGGGAGGCGGNGGAAGQAGGASVAVLVAGSLNGSQPQLVANQVQRGTGGRGGDGGNGGTGGAGGGGGLGGNAGWPAWCAGVGGKGGRGGDGGPGGGGGGGCGGPALGVAVVGGSTATYEADNSFVSGSAAGTGGNAGLGGLSPDPDRNGSPGAAGGTQNVRGY